MIGYGSAAVNDQLIPVPVKSAFDPIAFGAAYTGPSWPRQGVYNVPPVVPSAALQSSMSPAAYGGTPGMGSNPAPTAMSESGNPFHLTKSPVLWVLGFIVLALLALHFIHFK